jgi:hypothetical protein
MTQPASFTSAFLNVPYQYDSISPQEAIYFLLKKSLGYPNTTPHGPLFSEAVNNGNSLPFITLLKQYNQLIPVPNPNDYILDPSWSNFGYTNAFKAAPTGFCNDSFSKRYYSSNYPYIAMYSNLLLTNLAPEGAPFSQFGYGTTDPSYGHPLLANAIPITFDPEKTYRWVLQNSNNNIIQDFDGYWLCDTDAGVITFYDSNTLRPQVSRNNLPRFTFYRYEGLIGATNVATTQDL